MKISEIIKLLEKEKEKRGNVEVIFHAMYGESGTLFEVMSDDELLKYQKKNLNIWTGLMTG